MSQSYPALNQSLAESYALLASQQDLNRKASLMQEMIRQADGPQKSLLQSLLAEFYYAYFIENLEALKSQPILTEEEGDLKSWSAPKLIESSTALYLQSLEYSEELKKIDLSKVKLPRTGNTDPSFRPTLYDFLVHRALDYFEDPRCILNPAPAEFRMLAQGLIMPPKNYLSALFPLLDSLNHTHISLNLYKELFSYQLEEKAHNALIDSHLRMIKWLRKYSSGLDKAGRYVRNLRHMMETYPGNSALADVQYEMAMVYTSIAGDFQPLGGNAYKWDYQQAWEISTATIQEFPKSRGAAKCKALIALIEKPALRIAAEEVNLPKKAFRMQVNYRNLNHLYFRLYRISSEKEDTFTELKTSALRWDFARQFSISKKGDIYLAFDGDFHFHRTEAALPSLPTGTYALCASNRKDFDQEKGLISVLPIKISQLYSSHLQRADSVFFYVKDRENGKGLEGVKVEFKDKGKTIQLETDAKGRLGFARKPLFSKNLKLNLCQQNDSLTERLRIPALEPKLYKANTKTHVFTDRPSYFRGEFIAIKGLIRRALEQDTSPIADSSLQLVISKDGNSLDTLSVRSNAEGVFEALYPLPLHVQLGKLYIFCGAAYAGIDIVERNQSPYGLQIQQDKKTYAPKDTVSLYGQMLGPPETLWEDADLRYLVTRDVRFPDWGDYSWWKPIPHHQEVLVKQGNASIDSLGKFQLAFHTRPDPSHPIAQRPVYFYKVRLVATDPEGEKMIESYNLLISESGKSLAIHGGDEVEKGKEMKLEFQVRNLLGEDLPFKGKVIIESLENPKEIYRKRRWMIPDLHLVSEEDYRKDFPDDVYGFEDDFRSWGIVDTVYMDSLNSEEGIEKISFQTEKWKPGMYRVRMILPFKEKRLLQKRHYFRLKAKKKSHSDIPEFFSYSLNQEVYRPGDSLIASLKSKVEGIDIQYQINRGRKNLTRGLLKAGEQGQQVNFVLDEHHIGNLSLSFSFIYRNEATWVSQLISVLGTEPDYHLEASEKHSVALQLQEKARTSLHAFYAKVPANSPGLADFSFGLPSAVKRKNQEQSRRYLEPARAALAGGKIWEESLSFPLYAYPSISWLPNTDHREASEFFQQTANGVLSFPRDRRSIPPPHRWINLFANVNLNFQRQVDWALDKWESQNAWKQESSFAFEFLEEGERRILPFNRTKGINPQMFMSLIMDEHNSFAYREFQDSNSLAIIVLQEHDPVAEAGKTKDLSFTLLSLSSTLNKLGVDLHLNNKSESYSVEIEKDKASKLENRITAPEKEGVYELRLSGGSEEDEISFESPLFVQAQNYAWGRKHYSIPNKQKKYRIDLQSKEQGKKFRFRASRDPAFFAIRSLPSLIAHVNVHDPHSIQEALFAISVLKEMDKLDPQFQSWIQKVYEGELEISYLNELEKRLAYRLRAKQTSNGAFIEEGIKDIDPAFTLSLLAMETDLKSLGISSSIFQQQTMAHALHYLDSLYLHPVPEAIIWTAEKAKYVELRKGLANYKIDPAWQASWRALTQLHEQEVLAEKKEEKLSWVIANLRSKRPGPYWQASILKLLQPSWEQIRDKGINSIDVKDLSLTQKKKALIFKRKIKGPVFLEVYSP
ncbi:MAG: hypothetical protein R8P61_27875 [Bacteroidia bacterium]|nr:hypothetical protein [Bacteroidia bacterium]